MDRVTLVNKLRERLGHGTRPDLRDQLYQKVGLVVENDPTGRAADIVAGVVADSAGKKDPGRYFAKVVIARLDERGFWVRPMQQTIDAFLDRPSAH